MLSVYKALKIFGRTHFENRGSQSSLDFMQMGLYDFSRTSSGKTSFGTDFSNFSMAKFWHTTFHKTNFGTFPLKTPLRQMLSYADVSVICNKSVENEKMSFRNA